MVLLKEWYAKQKKCLLNLCYVVAQWSQQPVTVDMDSDIHLHTDVLSSSRIREENNSHPCAHAHFAPVLRRFPLLHGSGAGYSWNWDIDLFLVLRYCDIRVGNGIYSRTRDAGTST